MVNGFTRTISAHFPSPMGEERKRMARGVSQEPTTGMCSMSALSTERMPNPQAPAAQGQGGEFLTFRIGSEEYGMEILKVQEIRGYDAVTRIANAPDFVKGVINLRGTIVPILDLRIKFNLDNVRYDEFTVVIVLNVADRVVGVVVDGVSDVLTLQADQIMAPPQFSSLLETQHLTGMGAIGDRMLILVDIERLVLSADMALADEALAA
jgi:purine-binding chemotaxis protein CheW